LVTTPEDLYRLFGFLIKEVYHTPTHLIAPWRMALPLFPVHRQPPIKPLLDLLQDHGRVFHAAKTGEFEQEILVGARNPTGFTQTPDGGLWHCQSGNM